MYEQLAGNVWQPAVPLQQPVPLQEPALPLQADPAADPAPGPAAKASQDPVQAEKIKSYAKIKLSANQYLYNVNSKKNNEI